MHFSIKKWMSATAIASLALVSVGCQDENGAPEAELTITSTVVSVEADGGRAEATYAIAGGEKGETVKAESDAAWIKDFDFSTSGKVVFTVEPNQEEAEREASVKLNFSDKEGSFTVRQAGVVLPDFTIAIDENSVTEASVSYTVTPKDAEMTYITMTVDKERFDSFENDEAYFRSDLDYFSDIAKGNDISLEEYLKGIIHKGEAKGTAYMHKPDKDYYVYAYGATTAGERLTDIYKAEFKTKAVERVNTSFTISYDITGSKVRMSVSPDDVNQYYIFNVFKKDEGLTDARIIEDLQKDCDTRVSLYASLGVTQDEAVKRFASKGFDYYTFDGILEPETEYVGVAVAVSPMGNVCSDLKTEKFVTGKDIVPGENEISISLVNVSKDEVTVSTDVKTSDHYVIGIEKSMVFEGKSDEEILGTLANGYQWQAKGQAGNGTFTFYSLTPGVNYSIFAFGWVDGKVTTSLYRLDFKTVDGTASGITFKFRYDKYFDGTKLAEANPKYAGQAEGKAAVPAWMETQGSELGELFYGFLKGDYTDSAKWPDDNFFEELLDIGYWDNKGVFFFDFDTTYTVIGFASDNTGAFGPMSRQIVRFSREGVSDISEFAEPQTQALPAKTAGRNGRSAMVSPFIHDVKSK